MSDNKTTNSNYICPYSKSIAKKKSGGKFTAFSIGAGLGILGTVIFSNKKVKDALKTNIEKLKNKIIGKETDPNKQIKI